MGTSKNNFKTRKNELEDSSGLSKNNGKDVKYRIRKQQEKESKEEVDEFLTENQSRTNRVP